MTRFIDLFSGAGGLSLGLVQAGWTPLLAVDSWDDARETYRRNLPGHLALHEDVQTLTARQFATSLSSEPEWIVGGPPCQGFSTVGKRERDDPRNTLFREFARVVQMLKPAGFLLENVVGLRDMDFVGAVSSLFGNVGYRVTALVLRSADFGVPQLRHRMFFVGRRDGLALLRPAPTVTPSEYVTVWTAIGDLPMLSPGESASTYEGPPATEYQRKLREGSTSLQGHRASAHSRHLIEAISSIPDGGNRLSIPPRLQPGSGYHNSYSRLHSDSPAVAVTQNMGKPSGTRCIHPFQHRGLTAREGARLQGFPDTYHFWGGMTSQRLQIANAVSPILARELGIALADASSWSDMPVDREAATIPAG